MGSAGPTRQRFESNLPVQRPLTEPDIALQLPGKYLVLIEAKFTSPNMVYRRGPRANAQALTLDELLDIYWDPSLRMLNYPLAQSKHQIHYQLWRNMIFAEWMAVLDGPATQAYHVNLVREGYEVENAQEFYPVVAPDHKDRFRRATWEQLYLDYAFRVAGFSSAQKYLTCKTANLRSAFSLSSTNRTGAPALLTHWPPLIGE